MSDTVINNKTIAKNTMYLYIRMFFTMAVSLYTSRIILQTLGVDDFGLYNIIGGVIILFSFVSNSLRGATQRFISYELGKKDKAAVVQVMNMSLLCHILFSILFVILAETVGLWFVFTQLNIPPDRILASKWVYQFCILTFIANIVQSPYYAAIIAHEKMTFYALISIIDVVLKLIIVFILTVSPIDKLITYAFLLFIVSLIVLAVSFMYCVYNIGLGMPHLQYNKSLFGSIFNYAGWSMVNSCAVVGAQQGGNILINIFSGIAANGAFGIANQVSSAVNMFVGNFQSAFNPQIVKAYSSGHHTEMFRLMNRSASLSFYLLLIIAVPFFLESDFILRLWLGETPEYAVGFCQLMIAYFLVDAIQAPLWMLIGATGKMKSYTIWSGIITILNVPISWILLKQGFSIYWVFIVRVALNIICSIIRPVYVKRIVPGFSIRSYIDDTIIRAAIVAFILFMVFYLFRGIRATMNPIIVIFLSLFFTGMVIFFIGINKEDKHILFNLILNRIRK